MKKFYEDFSYLVGIKRVMSLLMFGKVIPQDRLCQHYWEEMGNKPKRWLCSKCGVQTYKI